MNSSSNLPGKKTAKDHLVDHWVKSAGSGITVDGIEYPCPVFDLWHMDYMKKVYLDDDLPEIQTIDDNDSLTTPSKNSGVDRLAKKLCSKLDEDLLVLPSDCKSSPTYAGRRDVIVKVGNLYMQYGFHGKASFHARVYQINPKNKQPHLLFQVDKQRWIKDLELEFELLFPFHPAMTYQGVTVFRKPRRSMEATYVERIAITIKSLLIKLALKKNINQPLVAELIETLMYEMHSSRRGAVRFKLGKMTSATVSTEKPKAYISDRAITELADEIFKIYTLNLEITDGDLTRLLAKFFHKNQLNSVDVDTNDLFNRLLAVHVDTNHKLTIKMFLAAEIESDNVDQAVRDRLDSVLVAARHLRVESSQTDDEVVGQLSSPLIQQSPPRIAEPDNSESTQRKQAAAYQGSFLERHGKTIFIVSMFALAAVLATTAVVLSGGMALPLMLGAGLLAALNISAVSAAVTTVVGAAIIGTVAAVVGGAIGFIGKLLGGKVQDNCCPSEQVGSSVSVIQRELGKDEESVSHEELDYAHSSSAYDSIKAAKGKRGEAAWFDSAQSNSSNSFNKESKVDAGNAHEYRGKSIQYWREVWQSASRRDYPGDVEEENVGKTLEILSKYAGFFKSIPIPCIGTIPSAWGGSIGRFFSGRWNTHHGNAVQAAIANFFHMDGQYAWSNNFHSVEFILASVKLHIGNEPINKNGDFARVLRVIKEETKVDYFTLDAASVHRAHQKTN